MPGPADRGHSGAGDPCVADASLLAAILFHEPRRDEALALLDGASLYAPSLLPFELGNVGVKKIRAGRLTGIDLETALVKFGALDVTYIPLDLPAVAALAVRSRLTAYDASYLWVARLLNIRLETFDVKLREAYGETHS